MSEPFVFVVPLMSRSTSRDWARTSILCRDTVRSMLAGGPQVRVILVCNEIPEGLPIDSRISVISLPPKVRETLGQSMHDKDLKILRGLVCLLELAPCWLMRSDADDLISARLVPYILENGKARDGWFVLHGWGYASGAGHVFMIRQFHRVCGTSFIIRVQPRDLPSNMAVPLQDVALAHVAHNQLVDHFDRMGYNLAPVPFRAALYNIQTGVNSVAEVSSRERSI